VKRNFHFDRWAIALLVVGALVLAGWRWLEDHPQHNPWAPLSLDDPPGWATARKVAHLRDEPAECRAFLKRSDITFTALPPAGEGACLRADRTVVSPDRDAGLALRPEDAQASCAVNAGLALWLRHGVQPAAETILGARVVALEHLGTNSCRRIGGGETGRWSEHATGNAIDISAFVLADGRRIRVLSDWGDSGQAAAFLRAARDSACETFGTVLSPDYNAAHADHFHLDQAGRSRGWSFCR
jgi:hypothetical protein